MTALGYLFNFVVFPGFLFLSIMGFVVSWIDRKVSAGRAGPDVAAKLQELGVAKR